MFVSKFDRIRRNARAPPSNEQPTVSSPLSVTNPLIRMFLLRRISRSARRWVASLTVKRAPQRYSRPAIRNYISILIKRIRISSSFRVTAVARFIYRGGKPCVGWVVGVYALVEESAARARDRIIHASPLRFLASAASDSIITK